MPYSPPPSYRACDPSTSYHITRSQYIQRHSTASSESDSEHTTLIRSPTNRKKHKKNRPLSEGSWATICVVLLVLIAPLSVALGVWIARRSDYNNTLDPDVRDRIRHEWSIEVKEHERVMKHARGQESEWKEKLDEWNQKKNEWRRKEQDWEREWNEMMRRKREEIERVEREKRERERMHLYWEDIQGGDRCIAHKTQQYTARLANLLPVIDVLEACRSTSLTIRGVTYGTPIRCEDRRDVGDGIRGHWTGDQVPICSTYWQFFKFKGCLGQGSGLRRVESQLGDLRPGDNPENMCYSTPAVILGHSYSGPNGGCVHWGKYGYWGIWDIPDSACD